MKFKLSDPQRRRLSVSAVQGDQALPRLLSRPVPGEKEAPLAAAAAESAAHPQHQQRPEEADDDNDGGRSSSSASSSDSESEAVPAAAASVPRRHRRGTDLISLQTVAELPQSSAAVCRAPIKKVGAESCLFSGKRVHEVTVSKIAELLEASTSTYLVFGDPSEAQQRGFDHKKLAVAGTLATSGTENVDLQQWGIGYACKKGFKPESPNQDDFFVVIADDWRLIGIFDGHGPFGHDVSSFVHRTLPYLLLSDPLWEVDPEDCFRRNFRRVHELLEKYSLSGALDCTLSGTTGTVVLVRDGTIYTAHAGDSRAILMDVCDSTSASDSAVDNLTEDHKPTLPQELARIEAAGGEVRRLEGDIPHRVFIKGRLYPGLAMSRAIGDSVGALVGVTCDPETSRRAGLSGQYIVAASDGVWEFISTQEAGKILAPLIERDGVQNATSALVYEAWRRWVHEEDNVVDDVTCVILQIP